MYRRLESQAADLSDAELRIRLFQVAWTFIQRHLAAQEHNLHLGRDTRDLKDFGRDLLSGANVDDQSVRDQIFQRILSLTPISGRRLCCETYSSLTMNKRCKFWECVGACTVTV